VLGDPSDRDLLPVAADELGGRFEHPFAIAKCVPARLTDGRMRHLAIIAAPLRTRSTGRYRPDSKLMTSSEIAR
jgi:hypothetical protein